MNIGKLIAASLEDAEVIYPDADVADVVAELVASKTNETSPVVEVMQNGAEVGDVVDTLSEIAELAEIQPNGDDTVSSVASGDAASDSDVAGVAGVVSAESLRMALGLVLRSHGQNVSVTSLESAGASDRTGIALVARKVAAQMRASRQVSFESDMRDIRSGLVEQADLVKKSGSVLAKIQSDLKSNGALVQGKTLNYQGIYQFLSVDGTPRADLANVLKEEKAKLQGLVDLLAWFEKAYKSISLDRDSDPEKALDVLTRTISTLDYTSELVKFDGLKLLGNGTVVLDDEIGHPILDITYDIAAGDGSKAGIGSRALHSVLPSAAFGAVGGWVGGAVGGLIGGYKGLQAGAVAGAGTGIYFGVKKGITKADQKVFGKETNVELSVDDVIEFEKNAQDLIGLVDKIKQQLVVADQGDTQIRNYLKTLHANMNKDDRWKVGALKVAGFLATALVAGAATRGGGRYSGPVMGSGIKTHADEIIGNAVELVDAVYAANCSVAEVLVSHVLNVVKGSIGVGSALLGQDPAKAVK